MADLVRVRVAGREFNVGRNYATAKGLEVIDAPTHTQDGRPLRATRLAGRPVKPRKSVDELAAEKGPKISDATGAPEAEAALSADDNTESHKEN